MYYRGANAALLLYDITNAATFESVRGWLEGQSIHLLPLVRPRMGRTVRPNTDPV
jgi:GTPase SAR1 family protein